MRAGYDVRAVKRWRAGLACWASAASATPAASSSIGTGTLSSVAPHCAHEVVHIVLVHAAEHHVPGRRLCATPGETTRSVCASTDAGRAQAPIPAALHTHMAAVHSRIAVPCTMRQMAQAGGSCPGSLWSRRGVVSSASETTLCATHLAMRARAPIPHPAACQRLRQRVKRGLSSRVLDAEEGAVVGGPHGGREVDDLAPLARAERISHLCMGAGAGETTSCLAGETTCGQRACDPADRTAPPFSQP